MIITKLIQLLIVSILFFFNTLANAQSCQSAIKTFLSDLDKAQKQKDGTAKAASAVKKASEDGDDDDSDSGSDTGGGQVSNASDSGGGAEVSKALGNIAKGIAAQMQAQSKGLDQLLQVDMKLADAEKDRIKSLTALQRAFWVNEDKLRNEIRDQESKQRLVKLEALKAETAFKNDNIDIDQSCRTESRTRYNEETTLIKLRTEKGQYVANDMTRASGTEKRRKERQVFFYRECMRDKELSMKKAYNKYELALSTIKINSNEFMTRLDLIRTDVEREKERFKILNTKEEEQYQISRNSLLNARGVVQQQISIKQSAALLNAFAASSGDVNKSAAAAVQKSSACLNGQKVSATPVDDAVLKEVHANLTKACGAETLNRCFTQKDAAASKIQKAGTGSGS